MSVKKKKKSASLGCLFWIAIILLIIVLFFLKRDTIASVLEKTGAIDLLFNRTHTVDNSGGNTIPSLKIKDAETLPQETAPQETVSQEPKTPAEKSPETVPEVTLDPDSKPVQEPKTPTPVAPAEKPITQSEKNIPATEKPTKKPTEKPVETRKAILFLVSIDADGRIIRKEVTRDLPKTNSPLVDNLNALFAGPTASEAQKGIRTLIPEGTKLLSASVKDGIATLNLNENFRFNQFGIEGYLGQLAQIVFTATSFQTVTSVQFLIDGQKRQYLGAEGVWIGTPLSRDKF